MIRLLDTNVCIDVLRGRKKVVAKLAACRPEDCRISAITEFELFQGAARAPVEYRENEHQKITRFLSPFLIIPFDSTSAILAAEINANLLNNGTPISITDVFIAATALAHRFTVVTNNTKDFLRLPNLPLEDWRK